MLGDPAAEQFCAIFGEFSAFSTLADDACGTPSPSFSALAYDAATFELTGVQSGGGSLIETRTAVINVPDYEGVYRAVPGGQPAYAGARVVDRLKIQSEDVRVGEYLGASSKASATDVDTVTATGAGWYWYRQSAIIAAVGSEYVVRFKVVGGTCGRFGLRIYTSTEITAIAECDTAAVGTVYSVKLTATNALSIKFGLEGRTLGGGDGTSFGTIRTTEWQIEDATSRTNKNPSEYETSTTSIAPVSQFATTNGNTVNPTTRVVTEATGTLLDPQPYVVRAPALTNRLTYSDDQTNPAWTKTNGTAVKNAVGIMGVPNGACTITATAANCTVLRAAAYTAASATHATRWWIKRKTGTGAVELTVDGGTTWQAITTQVNAVTYTPIAVDQAAVTNPLVGLRIVTSGDALYVSNTLLAAGQTKESIANGFPIYTTTAAVTRDACGLSFDDPKIYDTAGSLHCDVDVTGDSNILATFLARASGDLTLTDGTTPSAVAMATGEHQIGLVWGGGTMRLNLDGTWEDAVAYDGTLLSGALDLFRSATVTGYMRNLKVWETKSESAIDTEMAA